MLLSHRRRVAIVTFLITFAIYTHYITHLETNQRLGLQQLGVSDKKRKNLCLSKVLSVSGTPEGIRTPVTAVRGQRPRPLDHGGIILAAEQGFEP